MTISNVHLDLDHNTPVSIRARVSYTVTFTPLERHLAALGMRFQEQISILGFDGGEGFGVPPVEVLANFANLPLPVSDGETELALERIRWRNIEHGDLHAEDPGAPDEVTARVTVRPIGFFWTPGSSDSSGVEIVPVYP